VRRWACGIVLAGALAAPAAAHPGHAPPMVGIAFHAYDPATINVVEGDLVQWNWNGPDTNHSVTSDAGSGETFDSGVLDKSGATFTYYFAKAGTYRYHCSVHADMHGTVVVAASGAAPTDTTAPTVSHVRARVKRRAAVVSFAVDEDASMKAQVRRRGQKRVLHSSFRFVKAGEARTRVSLRGVGHGHFRVSLIAEDPTGNQAKASVGLTR
jgi:plastocyanin